MKSALEAAIFDMDGLLIDSEPFWRRAETEIFAQVGIDLTDAMCDQTMGLRPPEVVAYWYERYPWTNGDADAMAQSIVDRVKSLVLQEGQPLDGVSSVLAALRERRLRIGLATSSPAELIGAVLTRLGLSHYFDACCSGYDEVHPKPHPATYLTAARALCVQPTQCVAFEDSVAGVSSARAAGMFVVAVPSSSRYQDPRFAEADIKLHTLSDFRLEILVSRFAV